MIKKKNLSNNWLPKKSAFKDLLKLTGGRFFYCKIIFFQRNRSRVAIFGQAEEVEQASLVSSKKWAIRAVHRSEGFFCESLAIPGETDDAVHL
jgi:hypothetical protein